MVAANLQMIVQFEKVDLKSSHKKLTARQKEMIRFVKDYEKIKI